MSTSSLQTQQVPYPAYCSMKSLCEIFDSFDLDHDGRLTREEIRVCLALSGKSVSDNQLDLLISLADPDNDGIISREDFIDFHQNPRKAFDRVRGGSAPSTSRNKTDGGSYLPALSA